MNVRNRLLRFIICFQKPHVLFQVSHAVHTHIVIYGAANYVLANGVVPVSI